MIFSDGGFLVLAFLLGLDWPKLMPLRRRQGFKWIRCQQYFANGMRTVLPQTWILLGVSLCMERRKWCFHVTVWFSFSCLFSCSALMSSSSTF
uniref:Uncharacterized protein n=1 Tax=Arundo donax TaxID=35708 RepID=A0A0A9G7K3_ARUDO